MTSLYCYDDAQARRFEPFALTRPVSELRMGARLIRERWELATGREARGFAGAAHLDDFEESGAPGAVLDAIPAGALLVNARFAPSLARCETDADVSEFGERVVAVRLTERLDAHVLRDGTFSLDTLATGRP
ncbi:MAG: hypothetical protein H0X64_13005, partial [Gemmatimonadaceae bacterium]|nr:hypothetical protein [Gemmatimonadaceae bacterium]